MAHCTYIFLDFRNNELWEYRHIPCVRYFAMIPMAENVIEIDQSNFDSTLKANPKLVVDCWAAWCGPCRMIGPIIERMAKEYSGKVAFAKLNVDENPQLSQTYRIMAIPTLLFFKDGKVVDQIVGLVPKEEIEEVMRRKL